MALDDIERRIMQAVADILRRRKDLLAVTVADLKKEYPDLSPDRPLRVRLKDLTERGYLAKDSLPRTVINTVGVPSSTATELGYRPTEKGRAALD